MTIKDQGMHKPKRLPRCPGCNSKNAVGKVMSIENKNVSNGYFCSNCLTEWNAKGTIRSPLYA